MPDDVPHEPAWVAVHDAIPAYWQAAVGSKLDLYPEGHADVARPGVVRRAKGALP